MNLSGLYRPICKGFGHHWFKEGNVFQCRRCEKRRHFEKLRDKNEKTGDDSSD